MDCKVINDKKYRVINEVIDEMIKQYVSSEVKDKSPIYDRNIHRQELQFCFSCILMGEFSTKLTIEQLEEMFSWLTTEQLESIKGQLPNRVGRWF